MKKLMMWTIISGFALSLMACAGTMNHDPMHVKCPACGHEFDVDRYGK